jgi:hypothetical protein
MWIFRGAGGRKKFNRDRLFGIFYLVDFPANGQNPFHSGSARANSQKLLQTFFEIFGGQFLFQKGRFDSG